MATGKRRALSLTSDPRKRLTDAGLAQGLAELVVIEPRFGAVVEWHGPPPLRHVDNGLPSLLHIVTEQLISLSAAAAIWNRLMDKLGDMQPPAIHALGFEGLKQQGLSGAKARTFLALAGACEDGSLDFVSLDRLGDEAAYRQLLQLPGIGPWTAEIYLLTALDRVDVFPTGDRALQLAAHHLFETAEVPTAKGLAALAEGWRPWRSIAARLLWSHYRGLKKMPQAVS